jgi:predicted alpha/beta hydrolase
MRDWGERDAVAAQRALAARDPSAPVLLVGHSFGGQALGLAEELHDVRAAAMVGVQFGYVGHWPAIERARLALVWRAVMPASIAALGYVPGWMGIGEDLPGGVAREWARWCTSPEYFLDHVEGARGRFARFAAPTLFYSFTDDDYVPLCGAAHYLGALAGAEITHRRLAPADVGARTIGHFGFFRPGFEPTLWPEVARFFYDALEGRPSSVRACSADAAPAEHELLLDLVYGRE